MTFRKLTTKFSPKALSASRPSARNSKGRRATSEPRRLQKYLLRTQGSSARGFAQAAFATRCVPEGILWLLTQNEHALALGNGFFRVFVAFDMPMFITVRSCDAVFVTRQCQSCQFPSFGMAVPVSTRNNYVVVVRH
jgi:hypothetical protein